MSSRRIRIGISGARGMPALYGGFETAAAELAPRLVTRGFDVTVYCRPQYSLPQRPREYQGVRLIYLPSLTHRAFESPSAELICSIHSLRERFDILYVLGFRASVVYLPQHLVGTRVVFNTDGFDWQRPKWGPVARRYLQLSERIGVAGATGLIADSRAVASYFSRRYRRRPTYLSYGAAIVETSAPGVVEEYGLVKGQYYLVVARIEPENYVLHIIRQYLASGTRHLLAVVGGQNYETRYACAIRAMLSERVRLLGPVYRQDHLDALYHSCRAYIHGHHVGGTNPSLLRAMGAGALVLANGVVFNREVLGDTGLFWNPRESDLSRLIRGLGDSPTSVSTLGDAARRRVRHAYDWDAIADRYARYFRAVVAGRDEPTA